MTATTNAIIAGHCRAIVPRMSEPIERAIRHPIRPRAAMYRLEGDTYLSFVHRQHDGRDQGAEHQPRGQVSEFEQRDGDGGVRQQRDPAKRRRPVSKREAGGAVELADVLSGLALPDFDPSIIQ